MVHPVQRYISNPLNLDGASGSGAHRKKYSFVSTSLVKKSLLAKWNSSKKPGSGSFFSTLRTSVSALSAGSSVSCTRTSKKLDFSTVSQNSGTPFGWSAASSVHSSDSAGSSGTSSPFTMREIASWHSLNSSWNATSISCAMRNASIERSCYATKTTTTTVPAQSDDVSVHAHHAPFAVDVKYVCCLVTLDSFILSWAAAGQRPSCCWMYCTLYELEPWNLSSPNEMLDALALVELRVTFMAEW
uniref:Uncharacterized protein n=1 Tax=Anopheles atroparvus TaxID=41427 RepID=A0A182JMQ2_ANOAO